MQERTKETGTLEQGIMFPQNSQGKRSSTAVVKKILSACVADIDAGLSLSIQNEKNWRAKYPEYINRMTSAAIQSADNTHTIAKNGLDAAYKTIRFVRGNDEMSIDKAMKTFTKPRFHTGVINGSRPPKNDQPFCLPYKNRFLSGDDLIQQTNAWEHQGIFEPSFGIALRNVATHNEWTNLSGRTFVLMGAGSEIAPFTTLLNLGATVIAIDLKHPAIWRRLINIARQSPGKLILPLKEPFSPHFDDHMLAESAGADLSCDTPEIRTWLSGFDRPMTIGAYAYADGALHIRIAMAMDAIIKDFTSRRKDITIAFYLTPSDSYAVPMAVAKNTTERYNRRAKTSLLPFVTRLISLGNMFSPHYRSGEKIDGSSDYDISDNIIVQQGPGYILAKNIQKWRSLVARSQGIPVSANVAPATTTRSVFNNKLLAAGYAGLAHFKAEAFVSQTTSVLMTAALINDLNDKTSAANPETVLDHPLDLFIKAANHGGLWNVIYLPRSVLAFSVCLGSIKALKKILKPDKLSPLVGPETERPLE